MMVTFPSKRMDTDFHVFLSEDDTRVVLQAQDAMLEFSSLFEAMRHLRSLGPGFVVIHDEDNQSSNRIPFALLR